MDHSIASWGAPDGGALPEAASNGGPGGKPQLLRGSPKTDGGPWTASIPPWCPGSPRGGSPFLSLCWGKFPDLDTSSLFPFSPWQSKLSKVIHDKDHGSRGRSPYTRCQAVSRGTLLVLALSLGIPSRRVRPAPSGSPSDRRGNCCSGRLKHPQGHVARKSHDIELMSTDPRLRPLLTPVAACQELNSVEEGEF